MDGRFGTSQEDSGPGAEKIGRSGPTDRKVGGADGRSERSGRWASPATGRSRAGRRGTLGSRFSPSEEGGKERAEGWGRRKELLPGPSGGTPGRPETSGEFGVVALGVRPGCGKRPGCRGGRKPLERGCEVRKGLARERRSGAGGGNLVGITRWRSSGEVKPGSVGSRKALEGWRS